MRPEKDIFLECPHYEQHDLSESQIDEIAERAAKRAIEMARDDFYKDVGKSIVSKFTWGVGVSAVGLFLWLQSKGFIKL